MRVDGRRHWQAAMLATSAVRRHTPGTMSTTDAIAAGGAPEPAHATAELPQELLRQLRDGLPLPAGALRGFVQGIADGRVGDAQVGAFAMAVRLRGLPPADTAVLTLAMRDSGACLDWGDAGLDGPLLDKHSTGGIGDLASLTLGPMVAACGGYLPMLSGRGLSIRHCRAPGCRPPSSHPTPYARCSSLFRSVPRPASSRSAWFPAEAQG